MTSSLIDRALGSRALIRSLQEPGGAYPASPTFSAYKGYCWFRDGSFIADGMSSVQEADSATSFFDWCGNVILRYEDTIEAVVDAAKSGEPVPDQAMLPARFTFDGGLGDDHWWDFQLDGYGTWLWAVCEHARRHNLALDRWALPMGLTSSYLVSSWMRPCYDWWEEHAEHIHVSTLGCIGAGLRAAAESGVLDTDVSVQCRDAVENIQDVIMRKGIQGGHLVKWLGSDCADGSLSALVSPMRFIDAPSPIAAATIAHIQQDLCVDGGVYRFRDDTFFGGGRWPLLTCFLGLAKLDLGDRSGAELCLEWALNAATADGDIPEQVDGGLLLAPANRQHWIDTWGDVATPLLWSHAMVLRLAAQLEATTGDNP